MTDLAGLHARAAETLDITEPWVRRAFEAVPRHEFVPDTVWVVDGGVYRPLRRADDPERWARMVYDPAQAIATQVDDGAPAPVGGDVPTSSISAPAAVVTMLAELDLRPGHRVLEIGAGTGHGRRPPPGMARRSLGGVAPARRVAGTPARRVAGAPSGPPGVPHRSGAAHGSGAAPSRALRAIEQRGRGWGARVDRRPPGRWE
ncbi:hypothetical protein ACWDWU_13220 [Streptomyces sp. NPDC003442]